MRTAFVVEIEDTPDGVWRIHSADTKSVNPSALVSRNYNPGLGFWCPLCNGSLYPEMDNVLPMSICEAPWPNYGGDVMAQIFRCPHCGEPYWFHIAKDTQELIEEELRVIKSQNPLDSLP